MKKSVKFIILGIIALAVIGGSIYTMTAPLIVPLTQVTAKTAELTFSEQGQVVAEEVVQVYPSAQGRLLSVDVAEGQNVKKGDILCVIDAEPLLLQLNQHESVGKSYEAQIANLDTENAKAISGLETSKRSLQGELAALEAQERSSSLSLEAQNVSLEEQLRLQDILIEQNEKDLARARDELSKAEALYAAGSLSRFEYEAAADAAGKYESALEASKLQRSVIESGKATSSEDYYSGAKASLRAQIAGIDQSLKQNYTQAMKDYYSALIDGNKASVSQLERDIENCAVTAPADGIVTGLNAKSTNYASPAAPVAEITVPGGNMVEVYVSTTDVDSIQLGDLVELTLKRREGDAALDGTVTGIETTAEVRLSSLGVEERKVKVHIAPKLEGITEGVSFGIGYSMDVKFFVYREDNKLAVPKTALFKENGKDMLWVVRDGTAQVIEVTKGRELRTETVIETGLANGDYIVTDANNQELKNGVRVKGE